MINYIRQIYTRIRRLTYKPRITKHVLGEGNTLHLHAHINTLALNIKGDQNVLNMAPSAILSNVKVYTHGNGNTIHIAENCYLGDVELWIEDNGCELTIGAGTTIEQAHLAVTENNSKLTIGEDCMLARHIEIRTGDSHAIYDIGTNLRINKAQNVYIENHVWIGSGAKILKGSVLRQGCVVATGAIVTGEVPANCIASGIPAKVIKENIKWTRER